MRFAGYAALFDRVDRGGDVIRKGAFAGALGKPVPILWQHDAGQRIGVVETIAEDAKGLRVVGRLSPNLAPRMAVEPGAGLSFGYRIKAMRDGTNRELTALELIEVSVVRHPMQPLARVHAVEKGADE